MSSLSKLFETSFLTSPNYVDWLWNLRIILNLERLSYVLEVDILWAPVDMANEDEKAAYKIWVEDDLWVKSYMLDAMANDL